MKTIAVTGLSGVIGSALLPTLTSAGYQVIDLYHQHPSTSPAVFKSIQLDLTNPDFDLALSGFNISAVVHLAAITHIDRCENDKVFGKKGVVWQVNVIGTQKLVDYCLAHQIHLVYLSTECVFDGAVGLYTEQSPRHPKNWYGETKAAAEQAVEQLSSLGAIVRAVIAYQPNDQGKTIFGKLKPALLERKPISVVNDQEITPTYTGDITRAVLKILNQSAAGIFHLSSGEITTPYAFAQLLAKSYDFDGSIIKGQSMVEYFGEAKAKLRLKHATLDGTKTSRALGIRVRTPQEVLAR